METVTETRVPVSGEVEKLIVEKKNSENAGDDVTAGVRVKTNTSC